MSTQADNLKRSEECGYLENRIWKLRLSLVNLMTFKDGGEIARQALRFDDELKRMWEHSGLNEQPS